MSICQSSLARISVSLVCHARSSESLSASPITSPAPTSPQLYLDLHARPRHLYSSCCSPGYNRCREIEKKIYKNNSKKKKNFSTRRFVNANWQLGLNEVLRDCEPSALRGLIRWQPQASLNNALMQMRATLGISDIFIYIKFTNNLLQPGILCGHIISCYNNNKSNSNNNHLKRQ